MAAVRAKVGPKGQAVIPKVFRDRLGIRPGDEVAYALHGDHLHAQRAPADTWDLHWADAPQVNVPAGFDLDAALDEAMDEEVT